MCGVLEVLLAIALDSEQSMFKLSMRSNVVDAMAKSSDVNLVSPPFTHSFSIQSSFFFLPRLFQIGRDS
jgi:hypothetical protein